MGPVTLEITFTDAWTYDVGDEGVQEKRPLKKGGGVGPHVHGTLSIIVAGQALPMLGYFGPNDACLKDWAEELSRAAKTVQASDPARYVYDEGEQGQPAFVFERKGATVEVSVGPSASGDSDGIPEWGVQPCTLEEFVAQVRRFLAEFGAALDEASPGSAGKWLGKLKV